MLTEKQREYLSEAVEIENKSSERALRSRIRNRIANTIDEFRLLDAQLAEGDHRQIFEADDSLTSGIVFMISFVYRGLRKQDNNIKDIEHIFADGIQQGEAKLSETTDQIEPVKDAEVTIDIERAKTIEIDLDDAMDRFENREELTERELVALILNERVDVEEVKEHYDYKGRIF